MISQNTVGERETWMFTRTCFNRYQEEHVRLNIRVAAEPISD